MRLGWIKALFAIVGVYDAVLGVTFFFAPGFPFRVSGVTPPNHYGYVQFPALLLVIFGAMFFRIAADPMARREQILYGAALKASYFALVFWYQLNGGVPMLWIPWAWADLATFVLFLIAWKLLGTQQSKTPA
jgi:hypothetical protein